MVTPVATIIGKTSRTSVKAAAIASVCNHAASTSCTALCAFAGNLTPLAVGGGRLEDASGAGREVRAKAFALGILGSQRGTNVFCVKPCTIFESKAFSAAGGVLTTRRASANLPGGQALSSGGSGLCAFQALLGSATPTATCSFDTSGTSVSSASSVDVSEGGDNKDHNLH